MPDDGLRYEVIDGDLIVIPAPSTTHQTVSKRIQLALMLQIEQPGRGLVFNAPHDHFGSWHLSRLPGDSGFDVSRPHRLPERHAERTSFQR